MTLRKLTGRVAGIAALGSAIVVAIATPALAKAPLEARIEGPGIKEAIVVRQATDKEIWAADDPVRQLAERTGFWSVIGKGAPLESAKPPGDLGAAFTVTFTDWATVQVYPYAKDGPWSNVTPSGSHGWPEATGWVRSDPELLPLLRDLSVPLSYTNSLAKSKTETLPSIAPAAQTDDPGSGPSPVLVGTAALAALVAVGATAWRLLRRSTHPSPAAARPHP